MPDEIVPLNGMGDNSGTDRKDKDLPEDEQILDAARRSNILELTSFIRAEPGSAWKVYEPSKDTLLHRIAEGGYSNCVEAAKFILDNWKAFGINSQNKKGWTPLHNACYLSQQSQLVDLLIKREADTTLRNENGENPFQLIVKCNTPEAIKIADILLESNSQLIKSRTNGGENIVETMLKHSALNMLKFLWEKYNDETNSPITSLLLDGPAIWLAVQKGDGPDAVKCVDFLLDILPPEAVNIEGKDGNTALHVAAKYCYVDIFKTLVSSPKTKVSQLNNKGETCLHLLAQASGKYANPLLCVKTLFRESYQLRNDETERRKLILYENPNFKVESPLKVAVKNRTTKVARLLIKEYGHKETLAKKTELLADIYKKTPEAAIPMLDECITYLPSPTEEDLQKIKIDFGPVTGFDIHDIRNESKLIHGILDTPVNQQRMILSHPVVNIFLIEKWKKLQPLTYLYIMLYIFWLLIYSCLCYELFPPNCPSNSNETSTDQTGITDLRIFRSLGFQKRLEAESCNFNTAMAILFALILFCYTPLFVAQETIKFVVTDCGWKTYFFNHPVTILQWLRHFIVVVNIIPAFMDPKNIPVWQYHVGVAMFTFAWLMLLNDLANIPSFALLLSILVVTVNNYAKFLLCIGFPILVAFVPALCRYVAKDNQFLYLPFGIIKNFMLMTGEVEYKETFYSDDGPDLTSYAIVGQFIIVIAVFGFGLVLANVLTSVAVKNFQDLVKDAEYKTAVMQLKSINFVDSLVVWLSGFSATSMLSLRMTEWNHLDFKGGITRTIENMKTGGFSEELKQLIKEIAIQETIIVAADGKKPVKKAFG